MKKYICLSLVSLLSIPLVMSCKRGGSGGQDRYTETFDPVSVGHVSASLNVENIIENTYDKIKINTFVLKGTYHGCFGREENEEWYLEDNSEQRLLIKKDDLNCKLKITSFQIKDKQSGKVMANYTLHGNNEHLANDYSTKYMTFDLSANAAGFSPKLYSVAKISPNNFSTNPLITVVISDSLEKVTDFAKTYDNIEIFEPLIDSSRNIKFNYVPIYSINLDGLKISSDPKSHKTFYTGTILFKPQQNKNAQKYIIASNTDDLSSYEKVAKYFSDNSGRVVDINGSENVEITGEKARIIGKLAIVLPLNQVTTFKVIFAKSLDEAPNFYSYSVNTINIKKISN